MAGRVENAEIKGKIASHARITLKTKLRPSVRGYG